MVSNPTLLQAWFGPRENQAAAAPSPSASSSEDFSQALDDSLAMSSTSAPVPNPVTSAADGIFPSPSPVIVAPVVGNELIDVAVDIWGWDRDKVMDLRRTYGYTWVPSAYAPQVQVAPGLGVPGLQSYDPNNPGPDSIMVPPALP